MRRALVLVAALGIAPVASASPQDACTYDTCALRVSGRKVLQGIDGERVAGTSFLGFAPRIELFAERSDSAGGWYERFRSATNTSSSLFMIAAIPATIISVAAIADPHGQPSEALAIGLLATLTVSLTAGLIVGLPAPDHLSRAVWWYNRTLPPSGLP